jgi:DNA-binding transcriptional ArsR family regulator
MTESNELHEKVNKILQRVESIDNLMPWIIRPQAKQIQEEMLTWFKKRVSLARVYVEIDGKKTVTTIGNILGMKQSNVSRVIGKLTDIGLIEQKRVGVSTIYKKTKIDKILGLGEKLEKILVTDSKKAEEGSNNEEEGTGRKNNSF